MQRHRVTLTMELSVPYFCIDAGEHYEAFASRMLARLRDSFVTSGHLPQMSRIVASSVSVGPRVEEAD